MKLKKFEVNAFGGISPKAPVIIEFSSKFVKLTGDNGAGKTSLLNALLVALGHLSKDNKDFINKDSDKIDIDLEFVGNDRRTYRVRVTKSQFKLEYEGENLPEPISKIKELLGVPGVSPMEIKNKPLKEIVKWLAAYAKRGVEEYEKQLNDFKSIIKLCKEGRASANKQYKAIKEILSDDTMFNNWNQSEAKYEKRVDIKQLSVLLDEAGKKSDRFIQAESKVKQLKLRESELIKELTQVQEQLSKGEKYLEANKSVKQEYDNIKSQYDLAALQSVNYEKWQNVKRKKAEMDEYESIVQEMDAREKDTLLLVKELQAEIIPDVKGVELILEDEYENGKLIKKEGFYKDGVNSAQMSQGEWITTVIEILRKNKTKVLVIDEFEAIGSKGVELLEKLSNEGCYIIAGEVNRTKKELEIQYK